MLALGARCRRFESFRPDQKIQTVAFAAVLIFCLEPAYSNDKRSFVGVRIFHSVAMRPVCILGSYSNFALLVFTYSDSPRPVIRKAAHSRGFNRVWRRKRGHLRNTLTLVFPEHSQISHNIPECIQYPFWQSQLGLKKQ